MIIHIALFKWKSGTDEKAIQEVLKNIKVLKNELNDIRDISVGKNYHNESKGFTHGVVVLAENQEALDKYRKHPRHTTILKNIEAIEEDSLGFDFKT